MSKVVSLADYRASKACGTATAQEAFCAVECPHCGHMTAASRIGYGSEVHYVCAGVFGESKALHAPAEWSLQAREVSAGSPRH